MTRRCAECGDLIYTREELAEGLCLACRWWRDEAYPPLKEVNQATGAHLTVAEVRRAIERQD